MIVKFFTTKKLGGRASPRKMKEYLERKKQENKDGIELIKGDPERSCKIAEQLSFSKNYTAGCLSFAEADLPEQHKKAIIQSFEEMVFAGLEPDQYDITWIEHRDKGRLELNFFAPEVELRTGKRFQMYYHKRDVQMFNAWRDCTNLYFGLADPTDPSRRQATTFKRGQSQKAVDIKTECERLAVAWYADGSVTNRNELVNRLIDEIGFDGVAKSRGKDKFGKDYVTFIKTDEGKEQRFRLKGALFEEVAPVSSYTDIAPPKHHIDPKKTLELFFEKQRERAERHTKAYNKPQELTPYKPTTPPLKRKHEANGNEYEQQDNRATDEFSKRAENIARNNAEITTRHQDIARTANAIASQRTESTNQARELDRDLQGLTTRTQRARQQDNTFNEEQQHIDRLCERPAYATRAFADDLQGATEQHIQGAEATITGFGDRINKIRIRKQKIAQKEQRTTATKRKIKPSPYLTTAQVSDTVDGIYRHFDDLRLEKGLEVATEKAEKIGNQFKLQDLLKIKESDPTAYLDGLIDLVAQEQVRQNILQKTGVTAITHKAKEMRELMTEYQNRREHMVMYDWYRDFMLEHDYYQALARVGLGKIDRQQGKAIDGEQQRRLGSDLNIIAFSHPKVMGMYNRDPNNAETKEKKALISNFIDFLNDGTDPNLPKDVLAPKERDNSSPSLGR